ncbi:hypothetical protein HK102_004725, partial [Quaeritorhiza haematococci]
MENNTKPSEQVITEMASASPPPPTTTTTNITPPPPKQDSKNPPLDLELNPYEVSFPTPLHLTPTGTPRRTKPTNYIRTTKYTLLTFIPLNLYFQFKRFYNLYFLLGALSVFFGFSSLSPLFQVFPLLVVLFFAAVKDGIEDY